jgi:hypothetical protein
LGNQCSFIPSSYFRDPEESATRVEGRRSPPGPSARTTDSVDLQSARPRLRTLLPRSGPRSYRPCPAAPRSDGAHTPLPSFRRALLPISWCVNPHNALERLRGELLLGGHLHHPPDNLLPRRNYLNGGGVPLSWDQGPNSVGQSSVERVLLTPLRTLHQANGGQPRARKTA